MWYFNLLSFGNFLWHTSHTKCLILLCLIACLCILCLCAKYFEQIGHWYGFSPVWTLMWGFSKPEWVNVLSQTGQEYGLMPSCSCIWRIRVLLYLNFIVHWSHENGRSVSCLRRWLFSRNSFSKTLLQTWHLIGSSIGLLHLLFPWCLVRLALNAKVLWHCVQTKGFTSIWIRLCCIKFDEVLNCLLQWSHTKHFSGGLYVCLSICLSNCSFVRNCFGHSVQWCFLSVWSSIWRWTLPEFAKLFRQMRQE